MSHGTFDQLIDLHQMRQIDESHDEQVQLSHEDFSSSAEFVVLEHLLVEIICGFGEMEE